MNSFWDFHNDHRREITIEEQQNESNHENNKTKFDGCHDNDKIQKENESIVLELRMNIGIHIFDDDDWDDKAITIEIHQEKNGSYRYDLSNDGIPKEIMIEKEKNYGFHYGFGDNNVRNEIPFHALKKAERNHDRLENGNITVL